MDSSQKAVVDPSLRGRVVWMLKKLWLGSQSRMAQDLNISQGTIANIVAGKREPGRGFLVSLASHPLINGHWLLTGKGAPLTIAEPPPEMVPSALPVAKTLLNGKPADNPHRLAIEQISVPASNHRPSRYWYRLPAETTGDALESLNADIGDLLLLDSDERYWTKNRVRELGNRPCTALIRHGGEEEACLALLRPASAEQQEGGVVPIDIFPCRAPAFSWEIRTRSTGRRERLIEFDEDEPLQCAFVRILAVAVQLVRAYSA